MATNVLIITYLFPPSGGVGPPRYVAYTRYLPRHGCRVSVLTARTPHTPVYDHELIERVPAETRIHRVFNPDVPYELRDRLWKSILSRRAKSTTAGGSSTPSVSKRIARAVIHRVFNPDVQRFWLPFVMRAARRVIVESAIDAVILNTPPYSLWGVVPRLKREFPHVKWITEMRDDWLGYYLNQFDTAAHEHKRRLAIVLEREGVRASDFVVATTPSQRDAMRARYPDQAPGKFLSITNGYDADRYMSFRADGSGRSDRLVVTYFGSLYDSQPYDIRSYLAALEDLPEAVRDCIETRFVGRIAIEAEALFSHSRATIRRYGFLPLAEALPKLQESDYLLLVENEPAAISAKLFDYLPTGLPVLALTPPAGEVARVIRETGAGLTANGRDPQAIRSLLLNAYARWKGERHDFPSPQADAIERYERANLVSQFVAMTGMGPSGHVVTHASREAPWPGLSVGAAAHSD
jgi:glycosyl transferase family 4